VTVVSHARPRIVVSRCLGFDACRYNGEVIPDRFLGRLGDHVDFVQVCPEVEIGLGIPRDPIRIVRIDGEDRLLQPSTEKDLTSDMKGFRSRFLDSLPEVDGFVLKNRSPSCGLTDAKVHSPKPKAPSLGRGPGVFAAAVLERFGDMAVEDEGRLRNFRIREHFLTRIFTTADFRKLARRPSMRGLVAFHSRHKLLLMGLSQKELKVLGRIVANHEKFRLAELLPEYERHLCAAFARMPRYTSNINVLMHALGYFKKGLTSSEKAHFLDALEGYRAGRLPLSAPVSVLRSWIERFDEPYLRDQSFFEPFPTDLVEITDSGKGRGK
jgi:uncharacterized protein YbgA (DUF1722 family)/uncharacterized protein YbbK (DUF523 family)